MGYCAYDIVSLISRHFHHRNAVSLDYILDIWNGQCYILRLLIALRLVLRISFMAECGTGRIETHRNVGWIIFFEKLVESVHKSEYSRRVEPLGGHARSTNQGVVSTVNQCVGIKQKKNLIIHYFQFLIGHSINSKHKFRYKL